jgi:hypothetical protein
MAMIGAAGLLLPVIGWPGTRDPRDAGHDRGGDLGGRSPDGLRIHTPRVSRSSRFDWGRWRRVGGCELGNGAVDGGACGGAALGAELVGGEVRAREALLIPPGLPRRCRA